MSLAELQEQRSSAFSTLQMIEYFTGDGQAENKKRYRKYFEKSHANGDRRDLSTGACTSRFTRPPPVLSSGAQRVRSGHARGGVSTLIVQINNLQHRT